MMNLYPHLFSPIKLGSVLVQNRIVANPMSGPFEDRGLGGAGIVICGHTIVEPGRSSWMSADEPYAFSKYEREATRHRATVARRTGSAASIEIAHAGQYARTVDYAMGPDAFMREDGVEVRAMTPEMMEHTAACWAQACADAKRCGFDMAFLHFGHGWLMGQFLSPLFNHRTDGYGGSIEHRMRFPLQVLEACRAAVGPGFPLEMRVSAYEWVPGSIELADVIAFCREAQRYVTSIQVSCGLDIEHEANVHTSATNIDPHLLNAEFARAIKATVEVPVTLVGSVETPEEAEQAIADGVCDMVALARALAADPLWPAKAREGRAEEITPCLRCLQCYHIATNRWNVACSVNPRYGNEDIVPLALESAQQKKRVVVVGAGPAGCRAAMAAAERGHEVTVLEKEPRIGGMLNLIAQEAHKEDIARYLAYLEHAMSKLAERGAICLHLNCEATSEMLRTLAPDAVIIAVGAEPWTPPVPGLNEPYAMGFTEAIEHVDRVGQRVVVVGGGIIGAELALELGESGRQVTVAEMGDRIAAQANDLYRIALRQSFDACGDAVELLVHATCQGVYEGTVDVSVEGTVRSIACDTVIAATGVRSRSALVESLYGIAPQSYIVGDCRTPRVIKDATLEGYSAGAYL